MYSYSFSSYPEPGSVLTITYFSPDEDGETHHAVVPFPEHYVQAVDAALHLLGKYMADPTPKASDVVLKSRKPRDSKEWIWAEFEPREWRGVVKQDSEVGLFLKQVPRPLAPQAVFLRGPVHLVFGGRRGGLTTWTDLELRSPLGSTNLIDRPSSYAEAVEVTKEYVNIHTWVGKSNAEEQVKKPGKTLTFYTFQDTTLKQWMQFPSQAVTDDDVWKTTVPAPLGVLGVIAT
ncbi:hypothetical protein DFH06DRAFT_1191656 [Mycena polygramma]|nr:hypothetical protein DFH06DRAFT_1191656 [Mycena polygramma]